MKCIANLNSTDNEKIQIYGIRDIENKLIGVGKHQESRHAKQLAAKQALYSLNILNEDDYDDEGFNCETVFDYIEKYQTDLEKQIDKMSDSLSDSE